MVWLICIAIVCIILIAPWPHDWTKREREMHQKWCDGNLEQALDEVRRAEFEKRKREGRNRWEESMMNPRTIEQALAVLEDDLAKAREEREIAVDDEAIREYWSGKARGLESAINTLRTAVDNPGGGGDALENPREGV